MRIFVALTLFLASLAPALGQACEPSSSDPDIFGPACSVEGGPCYYVANDPCGGGGMCLFSIWIYQETNGIPGLQRGDEVRDDTCGGQIEADTIIF